MASEGVYVMEEKKKKKTEKKQDNSPKGAAGVAFSLLHDLLYVLAAITVFFVFFARLTGVHGTSMNYTLYGAEEDGSRRGDYLMLESNVLCSEYKQGDIVVAVVPTFANGNKPIVKRVVATPGQTVEFTQDFDDAGRIAYHVVVDGVQQDESFTRDGGMHADLYQMTGKVLTVPDNCYFLMGDNRDNSSDSRNPDIGMVDRQYIVGKALMIVFPGQDDSGKMDWSRLLTLGKTNG